MKGLVELSTAEAAEMVVEAKSVLADNDHHGQYTIPAKGLYPHQWLWDSCFIAIGLGNYDTDRAKSEIISLLRGQWSNGMLPHMIINKTDRHERDGGVWESWLSPLAPDGVITSGITQPPMLAEAVVRVGEKLKLPERRTWYQTIYPALLKYHQWLYSERDPHGEGLVLQIHPWETGMDNTPPWMHELHEHKLVWWLTAVKHLHLNFLFNYFRRDTHFVPAEQRVNTDDALALYSLLRRFRRKAYNINDILPHATFAIEDVGYNAILVRANHHLRHMAKTIGRSVPEDLHARMSQTEDALEQLWDAPTTMYYSRNFVTHKTIKLPTLATLLPLYAGSVTKERAAQLVAHLRDTKEFGTRYPVPSVPLNSDWFDELGYWQGPSWLNTNWLIIDGLRRYGYDKLAESLRASSLEMVHKSGFYEYFSPRSGKPAGIPHFSWTAALVIDLLEQRS